MELTPWGGQPTQRSTQWWVLRMGVVTFSNCYEPPKRAPRGMYTYIHTYIDVHTYILVMTTPYLNHQSHSTPVHIPGFVTCRGMGGSPSGSGGGGNDGLMTSGSLPWSNGQFSPNMQKPFSEQIIEIVITSICCAVQNYFCVTNYKLL